MPITAGLKIFKSLYLLIYCLFLLLFIAGCKGKSDSPTGESKTPEKVFPVEVTTPFFEKVTHTLEAVGSFMPEEEVTVGCELAGTIKRLSVDEGSLVKKGQLLLEVDDEKVLLELDETEALLKESLARLANAQSTLERIKKLHRDGVVGQQDFDDAQTQKALSQAVVEKLRAKLNLSKKSLNDTRVIAPIDGVISERMVSVGEYVKAGADLVKIVDSNPLKLVFSLPEKNAGRVKGGQRVSISTRAYPGKMFEGQIYFINPKVDTDTRTIEVKAWVDNSDNMLKPGFFANVTLVLGAQKSLVLPESAVVIREGSILVMVVKDSRIIYKKVNTGTRFDGKVEMLEGVTVDDRIVIYGRSEIAEGTKVTTLPPG